ncbi:unnamed protein product [Adineta steineri]|uniref:Uncharacterized protein n=1 Tax=Adineta steineri TaxID=433720 RepID=A0A813SMP7_9BILA|nr:unnamed protein product [Adineta steineri]CAF3933081.1 unnamed protein product [Adineta steineri]
MAKQSQAEIDQMIQRSEYKNRDLVRRDIIQVLQSPQCNLILNLIPYYTNERIYREYLCLTGTVVCQYKANKYNIPIEINIHQNHPSQSPTAKVKPTSNMYISTTNPDVQPDGTIINHYLRSWRHPHSDLCSLINSFSQSFSQLPPVYSSSTPVNQPTPYSTNTSQSTPYPSITSQPTPYPTNISQPTPYSTSINQPLPYPTNINQSTPYPTDTSFMPMPMPIPMMTNSHRHVAQTNESQNSGDVYHESLKSAVVNKISNRYKEITETKQNEISSLEKIQEDLNNGEQKIQSLINQIQQQQILIKNYLTTLTNKTNEISQKPLQKSESAIKDDAIIISKPISKQLLQCYVEDHAIDDLLYYLSDGLKRGSIPLDIYLKHVMKLSRKQFTIRATMIKCRELHE